MLKIEPVSGSGLWKIVQVNIFVERWRGQSQNDGEFCRMNFHPCENLQFLHGLCIWGKRMATAVPDMQRACLNTVRQADKAGQQ